MHKAGGQASRQAGRRCIRLACRVRLTADRTAGHGDRVHGDCRRQLLLGVALAVGPVEARDFKVPLAHLHRWKKDWQEKCESIPRSSTRVAALNKDSRQGQSRHVLPSWRLLANGRRRQRPASRGAVMSLLQRVSRVVALPDASHVVSLFKQRHLKACQGGPAARLAAAAYRLRCAGTGRPPLCRDCQDPYRPAHSFLPAWRSCWAACKPATPAPITANFEPAGTGMLLSGEWMVLAVASGLGSAFEAGATA